MITKNLPPSNKNTAAVQLQKFWSGECEFLIADSHSVYVATQQHFLGLVFRSNLSLPTLKLLYLLANGFNQSKIVSEFIYAKYANN